jgi:hypothetical protein
MIRYRGPTDARMNALARAIFDIAMLRLGPEDLPASRFLLRVSLTAYVVLGAIGTAFYVSGPVELLAQTALDLILVFGFFGLLLSLNRKSARLQQTMTAVLGTGSLLYLVRLPLDLWLDALPEGAPATVPALLMLLLAVWSIIITGHILNRALEIPFLGGIVLGVAFFVINIAAYAALFPAVN